ncbi:MAG: SUMF1/EgtB/PvdO family nonheme iron enzyme [Bacteroidota bacterium]
MKEMIPPTRGDKNTELAFDIAKAVFVIVGVSRYRAAHQEIARDRAYGDRPFVLKGTKSLKETLQQLYPQAEDTQFVYIENPNDKEEVLTRLQSLSSRKAEFLFFYYGGHGEIPRMEDDLLRLTTCDCTTKTVDRRGIKISELSALLARIAPMQLVLLDCCYSGTLKGLSLDRMKTACIITSSTNSTKAFKGKEMPFFTELFIEALQQNNSPYNRSLGDLKIPTKLVDETKGIDQEWKITDKGRLINLALFPPYRPVANGQTNTIAIKDYRFKIHPGQLLSDGEKNELQSFVEMQAIEMPLSFRTGGQSRLRQRVEIGVAPVTFDLFHRYCAHTEQRNLMRKSANKNKYPATHVSWVHALLFCNWLSHVYDYIPAYDLNGANEQVEWRRDANGFRLPTEQEWIFAASSGKPNVKVSENLLREQAQYQFGSQASTQQVKRLKQNRFGLYDMLGNVWEWCWGKGSAARGKSPIPSHMTIRKSESAILKGGAFYSQAKDCQPNAKSWDSILAQKKGYGFRLMRNL